jgi:hypothetical protein
VRCDQPRHRKGSFLRLLPLPDRDSLRHSCAPGSGGTPTPGFVAKSLPLGLQQITIFECVRLGPGDRPTSSGGKSSGLGAAAERQDHRKDRIFGGDRDILVSGVRPASGEGMRPFD